MVSNTEYYDFFISYRREKTVDGNSEACVIYNTLRSIDPTLKIFYDIKELGPGDFRKNLEKAIKKSRRYVFLVNKDSWREVAQNGGDDWYYNEIGWAFKYLGQDKMLPIVKDKEEFRRISVGLPESIQKYFRDKHQIYNLKEDLGKLNKIDYDHVDAKLAYDICTQFGIQKSDKIDYSKFCFVPDFLTSKKLYGREEYAKRLYKLFFKNHQPIVSIVAMGGMGKTAFAHIYKSKYKSKYKHIHHIYINNNDLRGTFIDKMQTLISDAQFNRDLETFGDEGKMTQIIRVLKDIPAGPNLLVIDINNVSKGITDFFDGLISSLSKKLHILVLSRTSFEALENYRFVPFDSLVDEPQIAVEMFRDISGVKASECSDNEIGEIFARDGFNYIPILIETLSAHCKREHQYWNYNALCDAIDISRNSSIKYNPELRHSDSPEIKTVSQYLQKLISIEDFDTSSQKIMQHFVLWNCDYVPSESIKKLLSVYNLDDIGNY